MRAKKALSESLPKPKELKTNKVEDIQNYLQIFIDVIDKQWRLLAGDVSTFQIDTDGFIYFGNKDTLGTFRLGRSGDDWVLEHQTTTVGTWVRVRTTKGS